MSLTTEHHEHEIQFDTDDEVWRCSKLELRAKSLKALKTKIDKMMSIERRMDNLPVLTMTRGYGSGDKVYRGTATLFDNRSSYGGPQVWVNVVNGNQIERKKLSTKQVWIDTPENRELLAGIVAQAQAVRDAEAKMRELVKAAEALSISPVQVAALKTKQEIDDE